MKSSDEVLQSNRGELNISAYAAHVRAHGFAISETGIDEQEVKRLRAAIEAIPPSDAVRKKQGVYGVRNLLELSAEVRSLACSHAVRQFVTPILGDEAFAARAVFFDKVPGANWALGWHQDSVIAVKERRDVPSFCAWGQKAGLWQVQPPADVLARMLAIRVHLDDCGVENGPLRVLPGSHCHGWLDEHVEEWKQRVKPVACLVPAGGIVAMSPLLLHASSKSETPAHRRVIHLEFAADELPGGLEWQAQVGPEVS